MISLDVNAKNVLKAIESTKQDYANMLMNTVGISASKDIVRIVIDFISWISTINVSSKIAIAQHTQEVDVYNVKTIFIYTEDYAILMPKDV